MKKDYTIQLCFKWLNENIRGGDVIKSEMKFPENPGLVEYPVTKHLVKPTQTYGSDQINVS